MDIKSTKYLPGGFDQYITFNKNVDLTDKNILFIGSGLEKLLVKADLSPFSSVYFIVDDHDSLINARFLLSDIKNINIRMMEFVNTDFSSEKFDLVYVQGSISSDARNKIVKEVKRILKPGGTFCVSESVLLEENVPQFIKDIYEKSNTAPLFIKDFKSWNDLLNEKLALLTDEEKQQNKKLIKRIGHESKAYMNLGGSRFMGFKMLILKKGL